jgi:S-adenosylmethionine:tRNA ribosyltransferase-isomerase
LFQNQAMSIPEIYIRNFTYNLPDEKIARFPLGERDQSKVLTWKKGVISDSVFSEIHNHLPESALLVSNNTRVIHARLLFQRPSGARIEIFCLEPWFPSDYQLSFQQKGKVEWRCLVGNAKKWKDGTLEQWVDIQGRSVLLKAEVMAKDEMGYIILFTWDSSDTFASLIEAAGHIPIPPYLNRTPEESDNDRYQTLYAKTDGSVAAPTAGLHFTEKVLQKLKDRNIRFAELTLHVGAGTFQPVKSEEIAGHSMHSETVVISGSFLQQLVDHKGKIIAVGTTSVRSLESLYWLGLKIGIIPFGNPLHVSQWEPYHEEQFTEVHDSLHNIWQYMILNNLEILTFTTAIIIVPGYRFRMIDGMFTNFHQPQSTLLLLVAAFLGPDWKKAYEYALLNNFRFLSYGDSNLYLK